MDENSLKSMAVLTSAADGIAHYVVHLWQHLCEFTCPFYLTYARQRIDELVTAHIPSVATILDTAREESIHEVGDFFRGHGIQLANFHVATEFTRHLPYFIRLLSDLKKAGVHLIGTLHNVLPHAIYTVDRTQLQQLYGLADGYLVGNEPQRRKLYAHFHVGARPVVIAPQGPYSLFDQGRFDRAGARRLLGLRPDELVVLFFGDLRSEKGLPCLVRSLPLLRARLPQAALFIHTNSRWSVEPNPWLAELASRGPHQGIYVRNEFVSSDAFEAVVKSADVIALPYTNVTQSAVLNVAKAFRRPVVVTDIFDGAAEINRTYGRSVPVGDERALAEALADILTRSEEERQALGALALRLAMEKESWEHNAAALKEVCLRACTEGKDGCRLC
jgi:glycosyltransferase involved in cell wall biosynthesis